MKEYVMVGIMLLCVSIIGLCISIFDALPQSDNSNDDAEYQGAFDRNTAEVCVGGIVYYFGMIGNRSWLHPKIDLNNHSKYIMCEDVHQ